MGTQVRNSAAGYKIGTAASQKVGLWGATPVVQPASANQAAVALTGAAVTTTAAVDLATSEALANALKTAVNANTVDIAAMNTLITAIRTALIAAGIIKGAA